MDGKKQLQVSSEDITTLQHLGDILHLFLHRNHNQHRRSVWWRHFSTFRRQFNGLLHELDRLNEIPSTHLARTRKKARDPQTREHIERRLDFWQTTLVPKWQHAFSQVIADGRFAMLGLVLTAILAEICRITGIAANLEDLGQAEIEKALEQFAKDSWEDGDAGDTKPTVSGGEDLGEVISRPVESTDEVKEEVLEVLPLAQTETTSLGNIPENPKKISKRDRETVGKSEKKKKKRKKGGNAIDYLFSGF